MLSSMDEYVIGFINTKNNVSTIIRKHTGCDQWIIKC